MASQPNVAHVHSVAEAYLVLMVSPCPACGKGPIRQTSDLTRTSSAEAPWSLEAACGACDDIRTWSFHINPAPTREQAQSNVINPTNERSSAIDLLGWLTLFRTILSASEKATDRGEGRQLAYEAAQCLDEALRFYEAGEELPGEDAFFTETSLQRFRTHPQEFARTPWRERRLKLPDLHVHTRANAPSPSPTRKRWWRFWRR